MRQSTWAGRAAGAPLSNRIALFIGRRACLLFLRVFYRARLEGAEHIPDSGPLIVVSNHQSFLDPMLVGVLAWNRPFRSIARSGLFTFKPLGWLLRVCGCIPVEQSKGDMGAIRLAIDEVNHGQAVIIYPEGSRSRDGRVGPFQRGFQLILRRTNAPILPVTIEGTFDAWPTGRRFPRLSGRVVVRAEPVISRDQFLAEGDGAIETLRRLTESRRLALRARIRERSNGRFPVDRSGDRPYWEDDQAIDGP